MKLKSILLTPLVVAFFCFLVWLLPGPEKSLSRPGTAQEGPRLHYINGKKPARHGKEKEGPESLGYPISEFELKKGNGWIRRGHKEYDFYTKMSRLSTKF